MSDDDKIIYRPFPETFCLSKNYWQPSDTAPKDGTEILVWCGGECAIAYFMYSQSNPTTCWFVNDHGVKERLVTHWQPLPAPPEVKE